MVANAAAAMIFMGTKLGCGGGTAALTEIKVTKFSDETPNCTSINGIWLPFKFINKT